jgi:copper chaperone CopZ
VSVAMKKLPGVESVEARLNEGKAIVKLKPDNTVQFEDVIKVVREKAFTPKESRISARGEILAESGKLQLRVTGSNEVYELTGPAAELRKHAGKRVLIDGVIPAPKDKAYQKLIEVKSVKSAS